MAVQPIYVLVRPPSAEYVFWIWLVRTMIASHPERRTACHCRHVVLVLYPLRGVDLVVSAARSGRSKG